ncbi:chaperonin 10-like protein [Leucosporidium creatinivorum]|uniref:alcohol dehydrogenase n=1 Tax=Leucosporidium creatinivorum TaxID=106004 RepID=A0A1Y2F5S0_9BASI|nr:chaperonin 10-like protein [Leucosporidium creatinivorum]
MSTIPAQARAAVLQAVGSSYEILNAAVPQPGPGEVLVRLQASGCCHSDVDAHTPKSPDALQPIRPLVGGHEGIGRVVLLGPGAEAHRKVGELVGIAFLAWSCGACEACTQASENLCQKAKFSGFTAQGTFAEYAVASAAHTIPIPDSLSAEQACPILCAGLTVYKGLKLVNPLAGQWCVIPGAGGGLGHLACQYASAMGLRVVGIDAPAKRDLVLRCGAEHFIDFTICGDVVAEVLKLTEGGAHVSMICSAHPSAYSQALAYARVLGTVVAIGLCPFGLHSAQLISKGLKLVGSMVGTVTDAKEALSFAARGLVKCEVETRGMEDIEQTLQDLEAGRIAGRVVIKIASEDF